MNDATPMSLRDRLARADQAREDKALGKFVADAEAEPVYCPECGFNVATGHASTCSSGEPDKLVTRYECSGTATFVSAGAMAAPIHSPLVLENPPLLTAEEEAFLARLPCQPGAPLVEPSDCIVPGLITAACLGIIALILFAAAMAGGAR